MGDLKNLLTEVGIYSGLLNSIEVSDALRNKEYLLWVNAESLKIQTNHWLNTLKYQFIQSIDMYLLNFYNVHNFSNHNHTNTQALVKEFIV